MNKILHILTFLLFQVVSISATTIDSFPVAWKGVWTGELHIFSSGKPVQKINMEVELQPIDSSKEGRWTFGLTYVNKDKDWRPYELVPVAPEKGLWKVDEKNSIVMESYLLDNKLLCWFVVEGSRVLCTYTLEGEHLIFEVISGKETAVSETGNTKQGEEDIPLVSTYPIGVYQRAILSKK